MDTSHIIFFMSDDSTIYSHSFRIEAWLEYQAYYRDTESEECAYRLIEKVVFQESKDMEQHQVSDFEIEYGINNCIGHNARNRKDFIRDKTSGYFYFLEETTKGQYLDTRQTIMNLWNQGMLNFEEENLNKLKGFHSTIL